MNPVFLIGFMASGKTTLGRALAEAVPGLSFVDLDDEIRRAAGMSVSDIFTTRGEAGFRVLESEVLATTALPDTIIACGGGTPCRKENMDFMLGNGTVVRLVADPEVTVRRLIEAGPGRPLVDAMLDKPDALLIKVKEMMAARDPHYSRAHYSFDANHLETAEQIAASVARFRSEFLQQ